MPTQIQVETKLSDEEHDRLVEKLLARMAEKKPEAPRGALRAKGAARYIGIGESSFYLLLKHDALLAASSINIGGARVWPVKFLDNWLEKRQGTNVSLDPTSTGEDVSAAETACACARQREAS